jgi:glutathione S-transferase
MPTLELISHALCPYAQRVAIVLAEKGAPFRRVQIDLADKPAWFLAISPLGKVPLLRVGDRVLFESAAICDWLDEVFAPRLHPEDPTGRAEHRAWIAYASTVLDDVAGLYGAPDAAAFDRRAGVLAGRFACLETVLGEGPWFSGAAFSIVDAAFAPAFRYFEVIEPRTGLDLFAATPRLRAWRAALAGRESVRTAVDADYRERLTRFLLARGSRLSSLIAQNAVSYASSG